MSVKQHVDKTSAADKSVGFDYQYYYFLNEVLNLKQGQTIGLEVLDDVHSELPDGTLILVQLKVTAKKKADSTPVNLTALDGDLWKTISNWCKVIGDKAAERQSISSQCKFVEKTTFLLASNKSYNESNDLLSCILRFQNKQKCYESLIDIIKYYRSQAKDTNIISYIDDILKLDTNVSKLFLLKIRFDLGHTQIIQKCKDSILEHYIDASCVDEVFSSLDSQLRTDNFNQIFKKKKITVSFEEFAKKYRIHFDKVRNRRLEITPFTGPTNAIDTQLFLRQLLDIGDITQNDTNQIANLSYHRLLARNNLEHWIREGHVTSADIEGFDEDAVTHWNNLHRAAFRNEPAEEEINALAQEIVDKLRTKNLAIFNQQLGPRFSNGKFYDLCELRKIGWRNDWEDKYK